jgi:deferrochelatase/peroxidase EfeB
MISRRRFLGAAGASGAAAFGMSALAGCGGDGASAEAAGRDAAPTDEPIRFRGEHQAGITTPVQDRMVFSALDVTTDEPGTVMRLLATWTAIAEALTQGDLVPGNLSDPAAPPADTGEAHGLPPSRLTITIGFGPSLFDGRFGLSSRKPDLLVDLPRLPNETLRPEISGGDICIQACADDPAVAFHAVRNMVRAGIGTTTHRWMQFGFGRTSSTSSSQATARNLLGFKDGTANIKSEEADHLRDFVWVGDGSDQDWMRGGSYVVTRKIPMFIENWDHDSLGHQEQVIGRVKDTGAPIGSASEFAELDLAAIAAEGQPLIPAHSHVRLAAPDSNGGIRMLRRGYNYTDGVNAATGDLEAGLFFIAYVNDPGHFVAVQRNLATDLLNEYIRHVSSGVFACPRGLAPGESWADLLFA